jgi:hypothetical protein
MTRKMPIGIQDFETIRTGHYVYVDKTAYVYKLANEGKPYFLGRPRRFGKSLFVSTLKYYFLGRKDLFAAGDDGEPLAITALEKDWIPYPVFHIDLNAGNYKDVEGLKKSLNYILFELENAWGKEGKENNPSVRFSRVIRKAAEKSGKKVVILIDEYDKPLLQSMENDKLSEEILAELKAFYSVLKSSDQYLQFLFLTGITKFSKTSVFSDLNQPRDITLVNEYSDICGITEKELRNNFEPELRSLGAENDMTLEKTIERMHTYFNGYHFSEKSEGIFNPFSVLNTLANKKFDYYWFATGTPTFLISELKKTNFHAVDFKKDIVITPKSIDDYRPGGGGNIASLLYQTGYLTIKSVDRDTGFYNLGFPNEEVEYGFLEQLLPVYIPLIKEGEGFYIGVIYKALLNKDVDAVMLQLQAFFESIPYDLNYQKNEKYFQTIFYLVFTLLGQFTQAEARSANGRADAIVFTEKYIYVFEFKMDGNGNADAALRQIDDNRYALPYAADRRAVVKIGVVFDPGEKNITEWKVLDEKRKFL